MGSNFRKGETVCGIESVKTAADVYAPVQGEVTAKNEKVSSEPDIVNTAAEKDGWLFKIKMQDTKDLGKRCTSLTCYRLINE